MCGALVIAQRPKRDLKVYAMHPNGAQLVQDGARMVSGMTPETRLVRGPDGQLRLTGSDNSCHPGRGLF